MEQMEHLISGNARSNNDELVDIRLEWWRPRRVDTNDVIPQPEEVEADSKQILEHDMDDMIDALHNVTNEGEGCGLRHERIMVWSRGSGFKAQVCELH